ncbi:hypothetical protein [Streptomyces venezuelae]|uniref:hypothetical protein n=1 Tax=Streptomyces venezuelae TaxID=54571 RepID=UPI0034223CCB
MNPLQTQVTVHWFDTKKALGEASFAAGQDLAKLLTFVEAEVQDDHWLVLIPENDSEIMLQLRYPIGSDLLAHITAHTLSIGQRVVVLPDSDVCVKLALLP